MSDEQKRPKKLDPGIGDCDKLIYMLKRGLKMALKMKLTPQPPKKDEYRASGDCYCPVCDLPYRWHPEDNDDNFLNVLCNGDRVKL